MELAAHQLVDEDFQVDATVCVEPGGLGKTMRVHVVSSLSEYPATESYNRNTVMQGLDGIDVTVAAGACELVSQTIKFDPTSWGMQDQIQLTAWAQEPLPSDPAEVYQAKQILWPFVELPFFADGFEDGTPDAWYAVVGN